MNKLKSSVKLSILFVFTFFLLAKATASSIVKIEPQSGGFVIIQSSPNAKIQFNNQHFQADSKGLIALGFHRELTGKQSILITPSKGKSEEIKITIAPREYNIQRVNGVPASRVTPPVALTNRIQEESKQVKLARANTHNLDFWWFDDFIWPSKGRVTGVYGSQRFYNGNAGSPHWGIDLAASSGTPVYAPAGGIIVLANDDLYYSGGTIILDHGGALSSTFLHLSELNVSSGQEVKQGDLIGLIGSTGRSTGAHLDWRMNLNGVRIDAALWVSE